MTRYRLAANALAAALFATPISAQTTDEGCSALQKQYDQDVQTANTLVMKLTNQILQNGGSSDVLSKLGLDVKSVGSPDEAIRKGVVAAMPPNAQTAVLIYLLSANTTMQTMVWKGCQPPQ